MIGRASENFETTVETQNSPMAEMPQLGEERMPHQLIPINRQLLAIANEYNDWVGLPEFIPHVPVRICHNLAKEIALLADKLPDLHQVTGQTHSKQNHQALIRSAYSAFQKETEAQYEWLSKHMQLEPWNAPGQPYRNSKEMMRDIEENLHLYYYIGGETHSLIDRELMGKFRAVHDAFGHALMRNNFDPNGEENAWIAHSSMYTQLAFQAVTTETRYHNCWTNFYPGHQELPVVARPYAPQKAIILPERYLIPSSARIIPE
jgi:hypothetical protein